MPALTADEVKEWGAKRVEKEMRDRLKDVASIRETAPEQKLANVTGEQAEAIRQHNTDLNLLGERKDAILELSRADDDAEKLMKELDEPSKKHRHGSNENSPGLKTWDGRDLDLRDGGTIFAKSNALKTFNEEGIKDKECEIPLGGMISAYRILDLKGFRSPRKKDLLGEDDTGVPTTEYPVQSLRVGVMVEELFQQPNIADLIPQATINQPAVPFVRETVNDQGAAETAEAVLAPEASLTFTEDSAPVRKIAVMLPVTEEILEDEALVRGHVNGRLPLFIQNREDLQLLRGNGTGQNLTGVLNLSGIDNSVTYSIGTPVAPGGKGQDILEAIFNASLIVQESFLNPDAVVTNLGVWGEVRLSKDKNGQYLIAPATESATPRVWGLRVVTNQNMPAEGTGNKPILVGAFSQASQIWRRRAITLAVSDSHNDNFGKGILVIKATSRLAVTHYRPAGYATVTSAA